MAYSMIGTGKAAALPKPRPEPKPKTQAVPKAQQKLRASLQPTSPEQMSAMNRVKKLTTKPDEWSPHDTQMQYVHDTLNHGVNAVEDRGDVSADVTARMYGKLHKASLHLNSHAKEHNRGNHGEAAAHLELAAKELSEVGSTLDKNLGGSVTHGGDNQTYPISFMKTHATTLANHYRTKVAGIAGPTAQVKGREYEPGNPLRIPTLKSGDEAGNTRYHMSGRVPAGYGLLSDSDGGSTRGLTAAQIAKGPTNVKTRRDRSPAEEYLANLPPIAPKMTRKEHIIKAHADLMEKGRIHKDQLAALSGQDVDRLHEITGVEKPVKLKAAKLAQTPMPRDREL